MDLHLVLDNYGTHKTAAVKGVARQARALPPALHSHEQFVAELGGCMVQPAVAERLKRGAFDSVKALKDAIR